MNQEDNRKYDDIIHLPHHVSNKRAPMSILDRAAQFSPFAALTGYDAAIRETARLTDQPMELEEDGKAMLNEKLRFIMERIDEQPEITVTYFRPDERKAGGAYVSATGRVKKINEYEQVILLADGTTIPFGDISEIHCVFSE